MIAGCGAYLLWLSPQAFGGVLAVAGIGVVGYYWLYQRSLVAITAARTAKAQTFYQLQSLTNGIKELLMSAERRQFFLHGDLHRAVVDLRRCNLDASRHHLLGESWTQSLYYLLIGLVLLAFPSILKLQPEALTGFVFAMLYLMNPVWSVIGSLPAVARGSVALTRIRELERSLGAESTVPRLTQISDAPLESVCGIEMKEVAFSYQEGERQRKVDVREGIDRPLSHLLWDHPARAYSCDGCQLCLVSRTLFRGVFRLSLVSARMRNTQ
jgi:putative ATP-binding cassette transporter